MRKPDSLPITSFAAAALLVGVGPLAFIACGGAGGATEGETAAETVETVEARPERSGWFSRREPATATVPAGTVLTVRFEDHLSSHTSRSGQTFRARVLQEVSIAGTVAIPSGSTVVGAVVEAHAPKRVGGRPRLALDFDSLETPAGETAPIRAVFSAAGKSQGPRDAAIIGGSTLGGAILGEAIDEGQGTVVGAIVGGLAGTAAAIKTRGRPVEVPAGSVMSIELTRPVTLEIG